MRLSVGQH